MKNRTVLSLVLLVLLLLVVGTYALTRYALDFVAEKRGVDAVDYVLLHGNVQHDGPVSPVRPTDVIGVYINEGYANQTMIKHLRSLSRLRSITIGPDFSGIPAGTPPSQFPKPSDAATADVEKMREAFPHLDVRIAKF